MCCCWVRAGRERTSSPRPSTTRARERRSLRGHQLRRHPAGPDLQRALRLLRGRLHGLQARRQPGKIRVGRRGHDLPRRDRRDPLELQSVLLRVIEDKSITRIGGSRVTSVDVRIIAATNKNLKEEVRKGRFRDDLYYRFNVFTIQMVPLRDRPEDIPLLVTASFRNFVTPWGRSGSASTGGSWRNSWATRGPGTSGSSRTSSKG